MHYVIEKHIIKYRHLGIELTMTLPCWPWSAHMGVETTQAAMTYRNSMYSVGSLFSLPPLLFSKKFLLFRYVQSVPDQREQEPPATGNATRLRLCGPLLPHAEAPESGRPASSDSKVSNVRPNAGECWAEAHWLRFQIARSQGKCKRSSWACVLESRILHKIVATSA